MLHPHHADAVIVESAVEEERIGSLVVVKGHAEIRAPIPDGFPGSRYFLQR